VILFHAWDPASPDFGTPSAAEAHLKDIQSRLSAGGAGTVRRLVLPGPTAQALSQAVRSERVSLLALSSHGRETSPRRAVASLVEEMLRETPVPIYVARAYQPGDTGETAPARCEVPSIRRILVPLDGSSACEAVMPYARELGQLLGARIILLHVSGDGIADAGSFLESARNRPPLGPTPGDAASGSERIEYAARSFSAGGLETMTVNAAGEPIEAILDFGRPSAVDLIALTTYGRTGLSRLLQGAVAEKVLREAVLPTLFVRAGVDGVAPCAD